MNIYIARHGDAEFINKGGDSKRNLTSNGILKIKNRLNEIKIPSNTLIVSSSYNRAIQTANLFQQHFKTQELIYADYLTPSSYVDNTIKEISKLQNNNIVIVSHLPLVYLLYTKLVKNYKALNFNTASIVHLEGVLEHQKMELIKNYD